MSGQSKPSRRVSIDVRLSRFDLPPVESALVVGRRAVIGSRAMEKALEEMMPEAFVRIDVEHPMIEALLVRRAHLRRVPEETLVAFLIRHAEAVIDDTEMLRVSMNLEVAVTEELEL